MRKIFILTLFVALAFIPAKHASAVDCLPPYIGCPPGSIHITPTTPTTPVAPEIVTTGTRTPASTAGTAGAGDTGGAGSNDGISAANLPLAVDCSAPGALTDKVRAAFKDRVPVTDREIEDATQTVCKKETVLDGLAYSLKQALIAAITQSIVDWINNGFEGGPSFVTNLSDFLGDIADRVQLDFIESDKYLGFLCSPFNLSVRVALITQQQPIKQRLTCSLGEVTQNIEGFINGNFADGGWPAWFSLTVQSQNNPYGALAEASVALGQLKAEATSNARDEYLAGEGYIGNKHCVEYGGPNGPNDPNDGTGLPAICLKYETDTPGSTVNATVAKWLNMGADELGLADEFNEIVNALIAQLGQKALTALQGLRGLSSRSSSTAVNGKSYVEQAVAQTSGTAISNSQDVIEAAIGDAIALEGQYQTVAREIVVDIDAEARAQSCSSTNVAITAATAAREKPYQDGIAASLSAVQKLTDIRIMIRAAQTPTDLNAAYNLYAALVAAGAIHTAGDLAALEDDLATEAAALADILAASPCGGTTQ